MGRDLIEIFGFSPRLLDSDVRKYWTLGACPFLKQKCIKFNHDQSIIYGTCSVSSPYGDIIICPNRLYANNYETIKKVARDAFGKTMFYSFAEFIDSRTSKKDCVVALGVNSGKEVKIGKSLSMDWVLALVTNNKLLEYVGIEVQSIDITGNYRDAWHGYKNLSTPASVVPASAHGLNWANVHKRLIPQIIRKGVVYSRSKYCKKGLYFVIPEIVYKKFEEVIGSDIPTISSPKNDTVSVFTYSLGQTPKGKPRNLDLTRVTRFSLDDFSNRFISGPNLPKPEELDSSIKKILGVS
jgi:hypothetical protein